MMLPAIHHTNHTSATVAQVEILIVESLAVNRQATLSIVLSDISRLDHKVLD
jgi:hypothetical protein